MAEKKNSQITVRISDQLHDALRDLAKADRRPVASYVTVLLEKHVAANTLSSLKTVDAPRNRSAISLSTTAKTRKRKKAG